MSARRLPALPRVLARRSFPWTAPTWPGGVERPPATRNLGVDYDTGWARRYGVRLARVAVTEAITRPLARWVASPTVKGVDRIEQVDSPAVFAANHASHVDTALILATLPERFRHRTVVAAGADYFFDKRWKAAWWAFAINAVPIERTRASVRSMRLAIDLLESGWNLVIYPEGGRSPDGWHQPHRAGAAYLAQRANRPIVPVHIEGTRRILGKGTTTVRPSPTTVTFGHPLWAVPGEDSRDFAARVEQAVSVLADEQATDWWSAQQRAARGETPSLTGPPVDSWRRSWALGADRRGGPRRRWPRL